MNGFRIRQGNLWAALEAYETSAQPTSPEWVRVKEAMWLMGRDQLAVKLNNAEQAVIKEILKLPNPSEKLAAALTEWRRARDVISLFQSDIPNEDADP